MEISKRAQSIEASVTLVISARAKKMQEEGVNVINFTVGEPDFNTPDYIISAAHKALDKGYTKYTASAGILPLRKKICEKLQRDNNLNYQPNQIVVSNGAKQALANTMLALIDTGDEVIIPAPYWITYPELVKLAGGIPVIITGGKDFKITPTQLASAITKKTKAVIINSPNNPSGAVYTKAELTEFAKILKNTNQPIWAISDEIYENLIYPNNNTDTNTDINANYTKHFSIAEIHPQTVVINGFSKTYSMTGWRIGYSASPTEVANAIDSIQSHLTSNVNTIAQYAALEAFSGTEGEKFLKSMTTEFRKRRDYMISRLKKIESTCTKTAAKKYCLEVPFTPNGAFYIMVKTNLSAEVLLERARIATVPGEAFGAPGFIRFCYTVSMKDIEEGMNRLENLIASQQN